MKSRADDEGLGEAVRAPAARRTQMQSPSCAPSPSSCSKRGMSCGVEMTRMSRMPASISVDSG